MLCRSYTWLAVLGVTALVFSKVDDNMLTTWRTLAFVGGCMLVSAGLLQALSATQVASSLAGVSIPERFRGPWWERGSIWDGTRY